MFSPAKKKSKATKNTAHNGVSNVESELEDGIDKEKLSVLLSMGFEAKKITKALSDSNNSLDDSIALLLRESEEEEDQKDYTNEKHKKPLGKVDTKNTKIVEESEEEFDDTLLPKEHIPLGNLASQCDVEPNNAALIDRWNANKEFRSRGFEQYLAKAVLGKNWKKRYLLLLNGLCPLAFSGENSWTSFVDELKSALKSTNTSGSFGLRGTGATFVSMHPRKGQNPNMAQIEKEVKNDPQLTKLRKTLHYFDCKAEKTANMKELSEYELFEIYSDLDININSPQIVSLLKKKGCSPSDQSVGNNYNQDDTMEAIPDLWAFKAKWTEILRRDISFVTINSAATQSTYHDHPFTYRY
jgi:hypothetical protein